MNQEDANVRHSECGFWNLFNFFHRVLLCFKSLSSWLLTQWIVQRSPRNTHLMMWMCRCIWMAESPVDSRLGNLCFHVQKKTGQFFCCGACEPKPAIVRAKLFLWYWELMVVCGGSCLCVTGGWGSTSLDSASWICRWLEPQASCQAYGHQIYYQGKRHLLCSEPAGHLSGGELRLKASCSHWGDNSFMGKSAVGVSEGKKILSCKVHLPAFFCDKTGGWENKSSAV